MQPALGLSEDKRAALARDGFAVVPGFLAPARCDALKARAGAIVDAFDPTTMSIFKSGFSPIPTSLKA